VPSAVVVWKQRHTILGHLLAGGVLGTLDLDADILMRRRFWAYHTGFLAISLVEAAIGDAFASVPNSNSSSSLISIVCCCGVSRPLVIVIRSSSPSVDDTESFLWVCSATTNV
jgi:hypothetical protein